MPCKLKLHLAAFPHILNIKKFGSFQGRVKLSKITIYLEDEFFKNDMSMGQRNIMSP